MSENTNGRMTPLEKMIRSSHYGLTDEQIAEAMAGTGEAFDVNSIHPSETQPVTHSAVIKVAPPDWADIQRLETMAWNSERMVDSHAYAHEYHKLAVKFTEDVLIYCIEQYNRGSRW